MEPGTPDRLPALDTSTVQRVLCVVPHPDDMEYGASAAVCTWVRAGIEVGYVLLTTGEAGMKRPPAEVGPLRAEEQRAACACVGVTDLRILDHPDGTLTHSLELRRDIAREIRRFRPDLVVTTVWDIEAYGGLNQADHRVGGLATLDATRDADNPWVFPELVEEGLTPWHAKAILVAGHHQPTHGVVVDEEAVEKAVASLEAHAAYLADLPGHPAPEDFVPGILRQGGQAMGTATAALFRVYDLGGLAGD